MPTKITNQIPYDTIRLFEMASFYRATSCMMSAADRQKCLDVMNG